MKNRKAYLFVVLSCLWVAAWAMYGLQGCAGKELKDTKVAYALALDIFANTVRDYNAAYAMAPEAVKETWRKNIDPQILAAHKGLTAWGSVIGMSGQAVAQAEYEKAFGDLVLLLVDVGAITIKQ